MSYDVRALEPADIELMVGLLDAFADAFEDPGNYRARPPGVPYLSRLLGRGDFIALVATDGDRVVGGLVAYVLEKFEQERSEIYIYDLAVRENYRRQGIATVLIERLRRTARARGVYVIFVQADRGDEAAVALYTKLEKREDVLHFDIQP